MFPFEPLSYRDDEAGLRARRAALLAERRGELRSLGRDLVRVYARRVARIAGGTAAVAGAAALVVSAIASQIAQPGFHHPVIHLTAILLGSVVVAPVVTVVAYFAARARVRRVVRRELEPTNDVRADIQRLSLVTTARRVADLADRLETSSVGIPLVGWALLAPLTLHFGFAAIVTSDVAETFASYDWWILLSLVLTVPAHATLAVLAIRFARRVREWTPSSGATKPSIWAPYGFTVLAGCLPGVILYLVPPMLVAVTGIVFIPATFAAMRASALAERATLALAD